jgi:hypothetical protein
MHIFIVFFFVPRTLDEKTRNIYKENVDLDESLRIYKQEIDNLRKIKAQLTKQATTIMSDKEMNDNLIKDKIEQAQKQTKLIKEVKKKPEINRKILSFIVLVKRKNSMFRNIFNTIYR